jgi:hypothetical protein
MDTEMGRLGDPEREQRLAGMANRLRRGLVMRSHMDGAEALEAVNEAVSREKPLSVREVDLAWLANRWGLVDLIRE